MKLFAQAIAAASIAVTGIAAAPAAAQVNGIATASPEAVIVRSQARQTAYTQIGQTYATQIQQVNTLRQEIAQQQQSLDTNNDGQLTEAEVAANPTVVQQLQQKEQQAATLSQPIALAQTYVVQQLIDNYTAARDQVLQQKNIQILINPDAIQYGPETLNVTTDIVNALNQRVPSVQTTPPANFQPRRDTLGLHQTIQQVLVAAAQQQAAQQAQQQQAQQPTGR